MIPVGFLALLDASFQTKVGLPNNTLVFGFFITLGTSVNVSAILLVLTMILSFWVRCWGSGNISSFGNISVRGSVLFN